MDRDTRRRQNIKVLMAVQDLSPAEVCKKAGLSVNALGKYLRGETQTMNQRSFDRVLEVLGIASMDILEAENPLNPSRNALYATIQKMTDADVDATLEWIKGQSGA